MLSGREDHRPKEGSEAQLVQCLFKPGQLRLEATPAQGRVSIEPEGLSGQRTTEGLSGQKITEPEGLSGQRTTEGLSSQMTIEPLWQPGQMKIAALRITTLCNQFKDDGTGYPLTDIGWYLLKNRPCTLLLLQLYPCS